MFQICGNLKQGCVTLWSRDVTRSQATLVYIIDLLCEALQIEDTLFFFTSRELACHQLTLRVIFLTMKESRNLSTCSTVCIRFHGTFRGMLLHFHVLLCGLCSLGHIPLPYVHMSVYEAEIFCIHYFVKLSNRKINAF